MELVNNSEKTLQNQIDLTNTFVITNQGIPFIVKIEDAEKKYGRISIGGAYDNIVDVITDECLFAFVNKEETYKIKNNISDETFYYKLQDQDVSFDKVDKLLSDEFVNKVEKSKWVVEDKELLKEYKQAIEFTNLCKYTN